MKRISVGSVLITLFYCVLLNISANSVFAVSRIENTVIIENPNSPNLHLLTVLKDVDQPKIEVGIPTWNPGYYESVDFARNISRLTFTDQLGRKLYHRKITDSLWTIETEGVKELNIEFDYTANSLDLNKSLITPSYAILNGTNFFFYLNGHTQDLPATVNFKLPPGWNIATGLTATNSPTNFTADNYEELVDCPALVGEFDFVTLSLQGVPHHLAVAPKGIVSKEVLQNYAADTVKVIDAHLKMFGEIPYRQYLTINVFAEQGFGGNEHSNSYLGIFTKATAAKNINSILGITSHEFFHAFNVKRIRPAEMYPYRFNERNYTPLLWVSEGVTNYYQDRGLLRAGFLSPEEFLQRQARTMVQVQSVEAAKYVSVEEASISTWLSATIEGEQTFAPNYYSRGQILGLLLDLSIRRDTGNAKSLDDVMRSLYWDFFKKNRGFTTEDLISVINRLTSKDYHLFFRKYVSGTEPLPFDEVLESVGLRLAETKTEVPSLGFKVQNRIITEVDKERVLEIEKGDIFLGVANIPTGKPNWLTEFQNTYKNKIGEPVTVYFMRDGKPSAVSLKVATATLSNWELQPMDKTTPFRQSILNAWKTGK